MNYELKIQKDLSDEQIEIAHKVANSFIENVAKYNGSYAKAYRTQAGYASYFKRNCLGYTWGGLREAGLTLRRISKNKRVFGIMRLSDLYITELDITADKYNRCWCPASSPQRGNHGGGLRVKMLISHDRFTTFTEVAV